jgi:hypothetical protein
MISTAVALFSDICDLCNFTIDQLKSLLHVIKRIIIEFQFHLSLSTGYRNTPTARAARKEEDQLTTPSGPAQRRKATGYAANAANWIHVTNMAS